MEKINFKSYKCKKYRHIDKRIMIDRVIDYITDPEKVARHSFLPFLRYERKNSKYVGYEFSDIDGRPVKFKIRPLMYAGHLDGLIYKYYSELLNICYNEWMEDNELNFFSVAYRTNKQHQSSINFAAEAISFIEKQDNALIIIGDFEKFFDTLDHKLLKDRLQRVLKVQQLPSDWYNIYKSLTKFAFIEKSTLDFSDDSLVLKNDVSYFRSIGDFRKFQKYNKCKLNKNIFGIPQGNSLSGVLANIYAIDFDRSLAELSKEFDGFYQRYSDDFIIVLDVEKLYSRYGNNFVEEITNLLKELSDENKIHLQTDKNKKFFINDNVVLDEHNKVNGIDYLGFRFDGNNVKIREKSIYKFYREGRKLIYKSKCIQRKKGLKKLPNRHKIYSLYTDFGKSKKYPSNFIKYAQRSQEIFDKISPNTSNLMLSQLKNRKKKIEKALGYRIHSKMNITRSSVLHPKS